LSLEDVRVIRPIAGFALQFLVNYSTAIKIITLVNTKTAA
jgi:hypothetical protein